jgi:hypothetical protein
MTNKITIKRSSVPGKVPAAGDLDYGELAINYADGNLFFKTSGNTVSTIASTEFVSVTGNATAANYFGNGSTLSGINAFGNVAITGGNTIAANTTSSTLTLTAGAGIALIANPTTGIITIASLTAGASVFFDGADFGTVEETVLQESDLGLVTDLVQGESDLGGFFVVGLVYPDQLVLPSYTVSTLPSVNPAAQMIFVTDDQGGAVPAFSDGTNWRRVTDRAVIS